MNVDQISGPVFSKPVTFVVVNKALTIFGTEF